MPSAVTSATRRHGVVTGIIAAVVLTGLGVVAPMAESATPDDGQTRGAIRAMQFALTPQALQATGDATATPTPRVIVIRPTPTPSSPPTATAPPNRAALPTATPSVITIETPAPTGVTPTPTATAAPTRHHRQPRPRAHGDTGPTATPLPTATPIPSPPAAPTLAPARDVRLQFTAEDWVGGYYRGDSQAYGRPWVAVYGALSDFPRATLGFTLDATPGRAATISITGLDDEWADAQSDCPGGQRRARLLRAKSVRELGRYWKRRECRLDDRTLHDPERRAARGTKRNHLCQPHPGRQLQCAALCPSGGRHPGDLRSSNRRDDHANHRPDRPVVHRGRLHRGGLDWRVLSWRRSVLRTSVVGHLRRRQRVPASDDSLQTRRAAKRSGDAHIDRAGR